MNVILYAHLSDFRHQHCIALIVYTWYWVGTLSNFGSQDEIKVKLGGGRSLPSFASVWQYNYYCCYTIDTPHLLIVIFMIN